MSKVIGIISIKGGVGKTTVASSIAADLVNHQGKKVLLVDANYSAPNVGLHMNIISPEKTIHHVLEGSVRIQSAIHNSFGVDVLPGSYIYEKSLNVLKLKDKIAAIKNDYDYVIIDSSPSLDDEVLSAMIASDSLFVVTTPDYPTISCSLKAARLAKQRGKPIAGMILNKVRDPGYEISLKEVEEAMDIPVIAKLPDDKAVGRSVFTRIPTSVYNRRSKFSKEIGRLNMAIIGKEDSWVWLKKMVPFNFKKEEMNRQVLKQSFYNNVF